MCTNGLRTTLRGSRVGEHECGQDGAGRRVEPDDPFPSVARV
jgi:hypothetical protein